jgi:hypothetical protein
MCLFCFFLLLVFTSKQAFGLLSNHDNKQKIEVDYYHPAFMQLFVTPDGIV